MGSSCGGYLVHGVDGQHNQHVHDVVRVEAAVHRAGEPLLRDVHRADHAATQGNCILETHHRNFNCQFFGC